MKIRCFHSAWLALLIRLITVITLSLLILYGMLNAGYIRNFAHYLNDVFTVRNIIIRANNETLKDLVKSRIGKERTVFWWINGRERLEAELSNEDLIESAHVDFCANGWLLNRLKCIEISVKEFVPHAVVVVNGERWAINTNGALASLDSFKMLSPDFMQLPIYYLGEETLSGDVVRSRIAYLLKLSRALSSRLGIDVKAVRFTKYGDVETVAKLPIQANLVKIILDAKDVNEVKQAVKRLGLLMVVLKKEKRRVASIDLAYEKQAVVDTIPDE